MDDSLWRFGSEVFGIGPFWYLFACSNRGRLLGFSKTWRFLRVREPWRMQLFWGAVAGTILILLVLLADDLVPGDVLLLAGMTWMTLLVCVLAWMIALDPKRRFAHEVELQTSKENEPPTEDDEA